MRKRRFEQKNQRLRKEAEEHEWKVKKKEIKWLELISEYEAGIKELEERINEELGLNVD